MKDENRLHVAEQIACSRNEDATMDKGYKTRKDHVRRQIIQEDARLCQMSTFMRQKRLNWYGHTRRR